MKIFSIRDNLIQYFMTPFVAPSEKEAMAAVAAAVNLEDSTDAIASNPSHFELWELGIVDSEGNLSSTRVLLCSCNSLRRAAERVRASRDAYNARRSPPNGGADPGIPPTASGTEPPTSPLSAR